MCSLGRHGLAFPHDVLDRPRHAWGLRPQIRSVRSNGAKRPYFNHIEHLAYVPGEHVPQGMWHDFLICYGQNGQDFIDIQRHVASFNPHCPSPPCSSPLPSSSHRTLFYFTCLVFFALLNRCILPCGVSSCCSCKGSTLHFSTCLFSICDSDFPIATRKIQGRAGPDAKVTTTSEHLPHRSHTHQWPGKIYQPLGVWLNPVLLHLSHVLSPHCAHHLWGVDMCSIAMGTVVP